MAGRRRNAERVGLLPLTVREAVGEPAKSLLRRLEPVWKFADWGFPS
jgi:hypothetical protein